MFSSALKSLSASPITSAYERAPQPSSVSGPWKIYDATRKKTGQPYSIFVFDRSSLSQSSSSSSSGFRQPSKEGLKAAQEEVVERLKKEASLLARLRHPCVLELVEPVEETRNGLQFVTERVVGSLGILLREMDEEERGGYGRGRGKGRGREAGVEIDELEIQKGLVQVGKGLEFLHESAGLVHGNLNAEAVMVNAKSDWKICALGFATSTTKPDLPPQFDPRLPSGVQLQLDFAAPDLVLDQTLTPSCDLFSLGCLIIALYNAPHISPLQTHNSASTYRRLLSSPSTTPNTNNNFLSSKPLPRPLVANLLPQLITRRPAGRLTARDFQQNEYFDNILVSTLRFLDTFPAKTPSEKSAFMRGLLKILPQFPRSVLEKKILPGLVEELRDGSLLALILPNIFAIVETGNTRLFSDRVLKRLKEVFISDSAPSSEPKTAAAKIAERERVAAKEGGLTVVVGKIGVIKEKTTAKEFKEDVLPLLGLALESPTHALQDLALRSLPIVLPKLDFPTLKNDLFPVVATVFTKTSSLGIKIRSLEAFRVLCGGQAADAGDGLDGYSNQRGKGEEAPKLDKYTIQEKVIPLLKGIKTKEPAVMMEALSVFREIGMGCDREVVAMDILPTLWAMSFGPLLGLEQFKAFMGTIKSLSAKIENEQIQKLSELGTSSGSQSQTAGEFLSFGATPGLRSPTPAGDASDFEALVFGKRDNNQAAITDGWSSNPTPRSSTPATRASPAPRAKSPLNVTNSGGAKFSWSTPSPTTATPASTSSTTSFPTLQPGAGFGSTTSLRASQPPPTTSTPSTSSAGTSIDWSAATKKTSFPASAPKPPPKNNTPSAPSIQPTILYGQTRQQAAAQHVGNTDYSAFAIAPPPASNTPQPARPQTQQFGSSSSLGALQGLSMGAPTQVSGQQMGMGMNMGGMNSMGMNSVGMGLSGMNNTGMSMGMGMGTLQPEPPKKEEKTGLDKWESLL